ncbi:lipopolysaccharide biosynthesis protein, partial [Gemmatimonadota bacterium]
MAADFKRLGRASSIYVLGGVSAKFAKFLLIPIYVRFLTPTEVGIVIWLEALTFAMGRFLTFGLGQAIKRFYVDYSDERDADAFSAAIFWVGFVLAGAVGGLMVIGAWHWDAGLSEELSSRYLMLAIVIGVLQSNLGAPMQRFVARQEPGKHSLFELLHFVTTTGLIIYFVVVERMGVAGVLLGQVVGGVAWNGVAAVIMTKPAGLRFRWEEISRAFRYGLPALPHLLFTWGITFVDRPILERYVSLAALGVYGIGYQLASVMPVLTNSILNAWIARFFRTADHDHGPAEYARTLTYLLSIVLAVALGLVVFAPEVVAVLTTDEYLESATILRLVALGLIFHGTYQALLLVLFFVQKTQWVSTATGVAFFVNIDLPALARSWASLSTIWPPHCSRFETWALHPVEARARKSRLKRLTRLVRSSAVRKPGRPSSAAGKPNIRTAFTPVPKKP